MALSIRIEQISCFDGVGVGSEEQGHKGRGQHDLKKISIFF